MLAEEISKLADAHKPLNAAAIRGFANRLDVVEQTLEAIGERHAEISPANTEKLVEFTVCVDNLKLLANMVLVKCKEVQPSLEVR